MGWQATVVPVYHSHHTDNTDNAPNIPSMASDLTGGRELLTIAWHMSTRRDVGQTVVDTLASVSLDGVFSL